MRSSLTFPRQSKKHNLTLYFGFLLNVDRSMVFLTGEEWSEHISMYHQSSRWTDNQFWFSLFLLLL